jgi:cytoskeletal protein CcmA (bactofilin family)
MKKTITLLYFSLIVFLQLQGQNVGDFRSSATGNWNATTSWQTWNGSAWVAATSLPVSTSAVNIQSGNTITINTTGLASGPLTVNGTLTYIPTAAAGVTVTGSVVVNSTGSFTSPVSGTIVTSTLSISANLQVNGNFNMNTFSTAGVVTTFIGAANDSIYGSGATCKFYSITVNKGTSNTNVLEVISTRVITLAAPTATGTRLTITNGTFKLSSASALTPYFGLQTLFGTNSRLWLNNASASVSSVNAGLSTGTGALNISTGTLQITAGTFSYGSGSDIITITKTLILEGPNATFNVYGSLKISSGSTFTMSAGKINVYPQAGNNLTSTDALGFISSSSLTNWQITGGTITVVDPPVSTSTFTALTTSVSSATYSISGATIRFGDGTSDKAGGTNGFLVSSTIPFGNIIVNNSPAGILATRIVKMNNAFSVVNLTVNSGAENQFLVNGFNLNLAGNITNSGTFNGNDVTTSAINFNGSTGQVVSGSGTFTGSIIRNITVNNTSGLTPAVDLQVNLTVSTALTLTNGVLGSSNASLLTIGNSASSATFALTRSGGSLQSLPAFSFGGVTTINYSYTAPSPAAIITTGFELPTSTPLTTFTVNNTSGVILNKAVSTSTLALTNGILTSTSANSVTVLGTAPANLTGGSATAYVNGPLTLTIPNNAVSANYKFQIGKTSYHLAQYASITTGGSGTGTFTLEAFDAGPYPGTAGIDMSSINTDSYFQLTTNLGAVTVGASQLSITQNTGLDINLENCTVECSQWLFRR